MTVLSQSQLLDLANQLQAATDREDWDTAARHLQTISASLQQATPRLNYDQKTLETVLNAVQAAVTDTERRRDEIGVLVRALGAPGTGHTASNS